MHPFRFDSCRLSIVFAALDENLCAHAMIAPLAIAKAIEAMVVEGSQKGLSISIFGPKLGWVQLSK